MDMEHTSIKVVKGMKVFGKMTCSMVREQKSSKMGVNMRGHICLAKNMDMVNICGLMDLNIKEPGEKIILKVLENISGLMGEYTKASGKII